MPIAYTMVDRLRRHYELRESTCVIYLTRAELNAGYAAKLEALPWPVPGSL